MMRQFELVDRVVGYEPSADEDLLNRAYVYATKMHGDQKRASGDPYFSHPVEVAGILTELHLDCATIATGLLHDTLEDTEATFDEITSMFGCEIAELVDGVTKLSKLEINSSSPSQAENFRKLLLATANDVRILLVKLADRLHNMRTLHFIKSHDKRVRIAQETLDIYAPLAGRMGMQNFREELEDLSFSQLNPDGRDTVIRRLKELDETKSAVLDDIAYEFHNVLVEEGVSSSVNGRRKRPFSIWSKMQHKSISLEQLSDIYGYRVIVDTEDACYRALGVLHRNYRVVPGRFKDYISMPKLNNYQSLHTTVIGPNQQRVEIQIRTEAMHKIAEQGVAAHWAYKSFEDGLSGQGDTITPFRWLQDMVNQLKTGETAEEFLENTKLELFTDQVFCFTPKGRLIAFPTGATVLDFAYAVHTEVGNSCAGARINGRQLPIRTVLANGDEIEIIRSEKTLPRPVWLQNVLTGKARAAIRHVLREQEETSFADLGERLVKSLFASEGVEAKREFIERAVGVLGLASLTSLYVEVGRGRLSATDVLVSAFPSKDKAVLSSKAGARVKDVVSNAKDTKPQGHAVPVSQALQGMAMSFEEGYFPLPGDPIVGILTPEAGLKIYPLEASALSNFEDQEERWVAMRWDVSSDSQSRFHSRLDMTLVNKAGSLSIVAQTIADFDANITNLSLFKRDDTFHDLALDIQVRDVNHAKQIVNALRACSVVTRIERLVAAKEV
mgnify:FL=1